MRQTNMNGHDAGLRQRALDRLTSCERQFAMADLDALGRSYLRSYPAFIRFFQDLPVIGDNNTLVAANFTFGWIPTIARLELGLLDQTTAILNRVKANELLDIDAICIVQRFMHSMVAASKLLHFVSPTNYAICDSKVLSCLRQLDPLSRYKDNDPASYLRFLAFCHALADEPCIEAMRVSLSAKMGHSLTPYRAIEFTMFTAQTLGAAPPGQ